MTIESSMVSVIVPVYNAAPTLEHCLHSIITQTYTNLEIILVNDGSTDNSASICDSWASMDSRILVLSMQQNEGVSVARNIGLQVATGDYCCFVDSDDWIDARHIEIMVQEVSGTDGIITGYIKEFDNKKISCEINASIYNLTLLCDKTILPVFYDGYIHPCWNKLFKMSIIRSHEIYFNPSIHISEDTLFCVEYLRYCDSVKTLNTTAYHYKMSTEDSLSKKVYDNIFQIYEQVYYKMKEMLIASRCDMTLMEEILVRTIYPQVYNAVFKIYGEKSKRWKEKKTMLKRIKQFSYCRSVLEKAKKYIKYNAEKIVVWMILDEHFVLLRGVMQWIRKSK